MLGPSSSSIFPMAISWREERMDLCVSLISDASTGVTAFRLSPAFTRLTLAQTSREEKTSQRASADDLLVIQSHRHWWRRKRNPADVLSQLATPFMYLPGGDCCLSSSAHHSLESARSGLASPRVSRPLQAPAALLFIKAVASSSLDIGTAQSVSLPQRE
jgi:hypothetical protein